jgi:hypothetical protein
VVCPRVGGDSPELGLGAMSLGASGGAFICSRGGVVAWARAAREGLTRGKTESVAALLASVGLTLAPAAPASEENRRVEASRGGSARFGGSAEDFRCAGRPTWPGSLSCTGLRQPAGLPAMGQGRGGERREKMMGLMCKKQKTTGAQVKNELKLILPGVKSKTFGYHFF